MLETCKDNAEQLWLWRVQIISNSWQQLVTSSRPNSCHDIVLFYVSPSGNGGLPKLYKGWGKLSLRVNRLSFSFKTCWWITGHLVTHLPDLYICTCKSLKYGVVQTWKPWICRFLLWLFGLSVLDKSLIDAVKWEKHRLVETQGGLIFPSVFLLLGICCTRMCNLPIYNKPSLSYPSASPPMFSPSIITVIVSRVGRQQGSRAGTQHVTGPQQFVQPMEFTDWFCRCFPPFLILFSFL